MLSKARQLLIQCATFKLHLCNLYANRQGRIYGFPCFNLFRFFNLFDPLALRNFFEVSLAEAP